MRWIDRGSFSLCAVLSFLGIWGSSSEVMDWDDPKTKVKAAAVLFSISPIANGELLTTEKALITVGFPPEAFLEEEGGRSLLESFRSHVKWAGKKLIKVKPEQMTVKFLNEQAVDIYFLTMLTRERKQMTIPECLKLAGFSDPQTKRANKFYNFTKRHIKKRQVQMAQNEGSIVLSPYLHAVYENAKTPEYFPLPGTKAARDYYPYKTTSDDSGDEEPVVPFLPHEIALPTTSALPFPVLHATLPVDWEQTQCFTLPDGRHIKLLLLGEGGEAPNVSCHQPPMSPLSETSGGHAKDRNSIETFSAVSLLSGNAPEGVIDADLVEHLPHVSRPIVDLSNVNFVDISKLTTRPAKRNTSRVAQRERQEQSDLHDLLSSAFKVGTLLLSTVRDGKNPLKHLKTADDVAEAVNELFRCRLVTGAQLSTACNKGRVGVSPPRRGCISNLTDEEMEAICTACFTMESIEQVNCEATRMARPQVISMVGSVANAVAACSDCRKSRMSSHY